MHLHAMFQLAHHHCLTAPWMVVVACCYCRRRRFSKAPHGASVHLSHSSNCVRELGREPLARAQLAVARRGHAAAAVLHARVRHKHIFKCMQSSAASALMCSVGVNNVEEEERLLLRLLASSLETRSSTCEGARARPSSSFEAAARLS